MGGYAPFGFLAANTRRVPISEILANEGVPLTAAIYAPHL